MQTPVRFSIVCDVLSVTAVVIFYEIQTFSLNIFHCSSECT